MKAIYTTPKLCKSPSGWFVWIRYNGKQKMFKAGLNRIKDLKKREREAKYLIESLKEILKPIPKHHFAGISSKRSRRCSLPYLIAKTQIHLI